MNVLMYYDNLNEYQFIEYKHTFMQTFSSFHCWYKRTQPFCKISNCFLRCVISFGLFNLILYVVIEIRFSLFQLDLFYKVYIFPIVSALI